MSDRIDIIPDYTGVGLDRFYYSRCPYKGSFKLLQSEKIQSFPYTHIVMQLVFERHLVNELLLVSIQQ